MDAITRLGLQFPVTWFDPYDYDSKTTMPTLTTMTTRNPGKITRKMRTTLFEWFIEVQVEYRLSRSTCALAMHLVDIYQRLTVIQKAPVVFRDKFQLLGVSCFLLASYMKEISPPTDYCWIYICDYTYNAEELQTSVKTCIEALSPFLLMPTEYDVIRQTKSEHTEPITDTVTATTYSDESNAKNTVHSTDTPWIRWHRFFIYGNSLSNTPIVNLESASEGTVTVVPPWMSLFFEEIPEIFAAWKVKLDINIRDIFQYKDNIRLGSGSYGCVKQCVYKDQPVAIKRTFLHAWVSAVRELGYLCRLGNYDKIPKFLAWDIIGHEKSQPLYKDLGTSEYLKYAEKNPSVCSVFLALDKGMCTFDHFVDHNRSRFSLNNIRNYLRDIAETLHYAHTRRIAHRDLSFGNLLVQHKDKSLIGIHPGVERFQVKVIDWGMARLVSTHRYKSRTTAVGIGTVWIRPPELLCRKLTRGRSTFSRSDDDVLAGDIWALGCIIVFMCIGRVMSKNYSTRSQWEDYTNALGIPTLETAPRLASLILPELKELTEQAHTKTAETTVFDKLSKIHPDLSELARGLLRYDPDQRFTSAQVIEHQFLQKVL